MSHGAQSPKYCPPLSRRGWGWRQRGARLFLSLHPASGSLSNHPPINKLSSELQGLENSTHHAPAGKVHAHCCPHSPNHGKTSPVTTSSTPGSAIAEKVHSSTPYPCDPTSRPKLAPSRFLGPTPGLPREPQFQSAPPPGCPSPAQLTNM